MIAAAAVNGYLGVAAAGLRIPSPKDSKGSEAGVSRVGLASLGMTLYGVQNALSHGTVAFRDDTYQYTLQCIEKDRLNNKVLGLMARRTIVAAGPKSQP